MTTLLVWIGIGALRKGKRSGMVAGAACCVLALAMADPAHGAEGSGLGGSALPSPAQSTPPPAGAEVTSKRVVTLPGDVRMDLVPVAPGRFRMGSDSGEADERPVREVRITRGFWMGRTEVTQAQYEALIGSNPSSSKGDTLPVEMVTWHDAVAFCQQLTKREQRAGNLPAGYVYRLPTEAEWEYAARGGPDGRNTTYAGSDNLDTVAWYYGNSGDQPLEKWDSDALDANRNRTHPVGGKRANELGLHDMSGNVAEWCYDWYQNSYGNLPATDPVGAATHSGLEVDPRQAVVRGGGWGSAASYYCRVANRGRAWPSFSINGIGFRVVLAPPLP